MSKKRGRKKKFRLNVNFYIRPEVIKSVAAVFFSLLSALSLISFFTTGYSLNAKIKDLLMKGFGLTAVIVPAIFLLGASFFIDSIKAKFKDFRVLFGLLGVFVLGSGFLSLFCWRQDPFTRASEGECGGLMGYKILSLLNGTVSIYGAALILIAGVVVSIILLFNISLNVLFEKVYGYIRTFLPGKEKDGTPSELKEGQEVSQEEDPMLNGTISQLADRVLNTPSNGEGSVSAQDVSGDGTEALKIKVLPSYSEPQGENIEINKASSDENSVSSLVPSLPYTNRVWRLPPLDLLEDPTPVRPDGGNVKKRAEVIESTLRSFGIRVKVAETDAGPSVTRYALDSATGTKISKIVSLQNDLALALASPTGSVRVEAPIPGRSLVGIEVPNNNRVTVHFKELLASDPMKSLKSKLGIVLGKDVGGSTHVYDIGQMPHLLVAGATGSGKSIFLHSVLFSILYRATPQECKFILIDPKRVEFTHYSDIPHLLTPVITDVEKAPSVFKWAVMEMGRRYKLFEKARARNIDSYNEKSGFQALPYIMIVVDELGEIMIADPAGVEKSIIRMAQLARATGIHLVLSVQRPSTNVITGLIKANISCRIAFNVSSQIDSRVIIDQPGAEKLLGSGDMLFVPPDSSKPLRLQGPLVTEKEISSLVEYLKSQGVAPDYKEEVVNAAEKLVQKNTSVSAGGEAVDALFDKAVEVCLSARRASASLLQRRLSIGYARAARILDELEAERIIGPKNGSHPREILIDSRQNEGDYDNFSL